MKHRTNALSFSSISLISVVLSPLCVSACSSAESPDPKEREAVEVTGPETMPGAGGATSQVVVTKVCATAGEEEILTLTCPHGGVVTSVEFASFGEPVGACGAFSESECHAESSRATVEAKCLGQSSCAIDVSNDSFGGDPCSFVVKHLDVQVACTSDGSELSSDNMGVGASSGTGGTAGETTATGDLFITDAVPGYASVAGGTSGGGTMLTQATVVDNMAALTDAVETAEPRIVLIKPGIYRGSLAPRAHKTIVGLGPGVMIEGSVSIAGDDVSNVIMRNIAVRGDYCGSYEECRAGDDAVYIGNGAHHIWLDHMDISDGQDGNCDITRGGDYITVSWSRFYYTYDKEHAFSNLIAGGDEETDSVGKLKITYMNSWWGERVNSRQPRGRFGNVHMLNNYHNTGGGQIHGVGKDMALVAENSVYEEGRSIWTDMGSPRGWLGIGNIGSGQDLNDSRGSVFEIPYDYTAMPANEVVAAVTSDDCGSGNTCTFSY